jgi:PAS domain S-box-containing protein
MSSEFFEGLAEAVTARRAVLPRRAFVNLCIGVAASFILGVVPALVWSGVMIGFHAVEWLVFKSPDFATRRPRLTLVFYGLTSAAFCALTAPLAYQRGEVGRVGGAMMLTSMAYTFAVSAKTSKPLYFTWLAGISAGFVAMILGSALAHLSVADLAVLSVVFVICVANSLSTWRESCASYEKEQAARRAAAAAALTERKAWQVAMMAEELARIGHWRLERDSPVFHSSQQVFRIYGLESENGEFPVDLALELYHPDDREQVLRAIEAIFETGEPVTLNSRIFHSDGEVRHVVSQTRAERDADGKVCAIFGVFQDVTEQVRAAEAIQRSEAQFRRMAENAHDLITCTSATGELLYISPSLETIAGYKPEDIIGRQTLNFIHPDDLSMVAERLEQIRAHPERLFPPFECRLRAKNGRTVWLEARPSAIIDPATGEYQGVTDVIRDITERKAMEIALNEARLEAERAAKIKGEFLANMSHELRTPLTSIIGFSQLLREDAAFSPTALGHIDRVVTASEVLLATVNDILDFSKLEAGQVEIRPEPVHVADIASETVGLFAVQAKAKKIDLRLGCAEALNRPLLLDGGRLRQILLNLVGNALKFTSEGYVSVEAKLTPCGTRLQVSVTDTGRGVPADELGRLFQRFSQVDGSIARDHGGTGLGLAICKGLVEAMGGSIHVESTLGQGSRFWFETPAIFVDVEADAPTTEGASLAPLHGACVLVVDDHEANRALVQALLTPLGCQVETASGGAEAVAAAGESRFDVILMDLRMPGIDGASACAAIRASRGPNARQPILAFTADASHGGAADVMATGFDDHVAKPIMPTELLTRVAGWVGRRHQAEKYAISA